MANVDKHKVTEFNGPTYGNDSDTGISKFYLITPTGNGNSLEILTGLLNEMPEFSISVNYENGPGAEWQDHLMSFMTSDIMQVASMLGSADGSFKNLLKMGTWTKKVYAGYKPSNINLNFRIYASDPLGQSPAEKWISALNNYATLNSNNEFSLNSAFENIGRAMGNMAMTGNEAGKILLKNIVSTNNNTNNSTDTEEKKFEDASQKVLNHEAEFNKTVLTAISNYNNLNKEHVDFNVNVSIDPDSTYSFWTGAITNKTTVSLQATYSIKMANTKADGTYISQAGFSKEGVIKGIGAVANYQADNETLKTAKASDIIDFDPISDIFNNIKSQCNNSDVTNAINKIIDEYSKLVDNNDIDSSALNDPKLAAIYESLNMISDFADDAGNLLVGKYDSRRVFRRFNKENGLGEKLWYLVLYPDAFFNKENPLIVYISDWEVKYSEEFTSNGKPIYCDFKITCCLDQIYSRAQWYRVLAPGVRDRNSENNTPFEREELPV